MLSMIVFAQMAAPTDENWLFWLVGMFRSIAISVSEKNYMPVAGFVIMLIVFFFNKFIAPRLKMGTAWLPWISALVGVLGSVAANLTLIAVGSTPKDWFAAIATGLTIGSAASGLWSMVGKKIVDVVGTKLTAFLDKYIGKPKDPGTPST